MSVFSELRRRNVHRMAALYLAAAWLVMQVVDVVEGKLPLPNWMGSAVLAVLVVGFPIALIISWFYELTPEGVSFDTNEHPAGSRIAFTGQRMNLIVIALLCAAVILFAYDKWWTSESNDVGLPIAVDAASIAVLAFDNLSPEADAVYFAEGISEEILNVLARLDGLKVTSRTSAFSFRGSDTPIPEIAKQLGVAHVLEGAVRIQGARVRITAQLIGAQTDTHLWSDSYDRELSDIFAVQAEIAQSVAVALQDVLGVRNVRTDNLTEDLVAYELFVQGRQMFYQRGDALNDAIEALRAAVNRDPTFAAAWAFLAAAAEVAPDYVVSINEDEANDIADEASRTALELDPDLGIALAVRARLKEGQGDLSAAFEFYHRAINADPNESTINLWLGLFNFSYGYLSEAIAHLQRSYDLDPLVSNTNNHLGTAYLASGQEAEARIHIAKARELGASFSRSYLNYLVLSEELDAALEIIDATFANRQPHGLRLKYLLVEAIRRRSSASLSALLAEEDSAHGPGHVYPSIYFIVLNFRDDFFSHYSRSATTTPMYELQPLWLPGNRAFVEDPRFFEIMSEAGADALWEWHGYPDGCTRVSDPVGDRLDCAERYH